MKRYINFTLALGLVVGFWGPVQGASGAPKGGGTLTMGMRKDITVLNPLVRTFSTDERVRDLMFESLLTLDPHGSIQPLLAESWQISNDGKTYTFHLRRGVKFHNGQEMTARDAKFAMDYAMDPKNGAYGVQMLSLVEGIETPDENTLRVSLKKPRATPGISGTSRRRHAIPARGRGYSSRPATKGK